MSGDVEALDFFPWKPLPRSLRTEETEVDGFIVAGANGRKGSKLDVVLMGGDLALVYFLLIYTPFC